MKPYTIYFFIPALFLVIIISAINFHLTKEFYKESAEKFTHANINSRIKGISEIHRGGAILSLFNDSIEYFARFYRDEALNDNKNLYDIAGTGDSIVKRAYGDTLFLFKNNRIYKYTFNK